MSVLQSFCLVFLAFTPLWVFVVLRCANSILIVNRANLISEYVGIIGVCIAFAVAAICIEYTRRRSFLGVGRERWLIVSCKEDKLVTVKFLIENVFPLFCFDCTTGEGLALTVAYFLVLASVAAKHRHFPLNVWLEWLGYSFYACRVRYDDETEWDALVVSKKHLYQAKNEVWLSKINNETFVFVGDYEGTTEDFKE
jgi:hypothetical protein